MKAYRLFAAFLSTALLLASCSPGLRSAAEAGPQGSPARSVQVALSEAPLAQPAACQNTFIPHTLSFATGFRMRDIATYASNGAGLAINDLDGNGKLDIVFASVDGQSTILWNQGDLKFSEESLDNSFTRGVNIVDVDGDGHLDITFTHRGSRSVSYWHNLGPGGSGALFELTDLPGVIAPAYAMGWADLNQDGSLDLVTGSYNTDLRQSGIDAQTLAQSAGVFTYTQKQGNFTPTQLDPQAETLSVALFDLNHDQRPDIWTANDFAVPDGYWLNQTAGWEAAQPFKVTSMSTMSIEWGDLDNNGQMAVFTTDMNPGTTDPQILAKWLPVLSKLEEKHGPNDPQIMANVLEVQGPNGRWTDQAPRRGIDATGWSWSSRFGDLNNDGYLDLYVTNGMIASNLFSFLDNYELVEPDRAFRNNGKGGFVAAPEWNLASKASGRGMVMADLNNDGRLDIVVNNMRGSAELFENSLCTGAGLEVDLNWPGSGNTRAIGAQLELHTSQGVFRRDVRASGGYLSGDPQRIHFGLPDGAQIQKLVVLYPDGAQAEVLDLSAQHVYTISR